MAILYGAILFNFFSIVQLFRGSVVAGIASVTCCEGEVWRGVAAVRKR